MHFDLFLSLIIVYENFALLDRMHLEVLILNETFAFRAFRCFDCAQIYMAHPLLESKRLIAVLTRFGPHLASILVISKHLFERLKLAVLALNLDMCFSLVLLLISLRDYDTTLSTLVVDPCTLHLVHAVLGCFDLALTIST